MYDETLGASRQPCSTAQPAATYDAPLQPVHTPATPPRAWLQHDHSPQQHLPHQHTQTHALPYLPHTTQRSATPHTPIRYLTAAPQPTMLPQCEWHPKQADALASGLRTHTLPYLPPTLPHHKLNSPTCSQSPPHSCPETPPTPRSSARLSPPACHWPAASPSGTSSLSAGSRLTL